MTQADRAKQLLEFLGGADLKVSSKGRLFGKPPGAKLCYGHPPNPFTDLPTARALVRKLNQEQQLQCMEELAFLTQPQHPIEIYSDRESRLTCFLAEPEQIATAVHQVKFGGE